MKTTTLIGLVLATCCLATHSANAQTVQFNPGMTAATGITGLTVGGTVYDVDFTGRFTHLEWASMLDVTTLVDADAVAQAIGDALDDANVALIEFDTASGNVFEFTTASLWYDTNATSLLGVSITAGGGWGTFIGSSNAPLNSSRPFAIDLIVSTAELDADEDGVQDPDDNCLLTANPDQLDTDGDDYGNACDADFSNDCTVNATDLGLFKAAFFSTNALFDLSGDGIVNATDLGLLKGAFFQPPGPSGVTALCN